MRGFELPLRAACVLLFLVNCWVAYSSDVVRDAFESFRWLVGALLRRLQRMSRRQREAVFNASAGRSVHDQLEVCIAGCCVTVRVLQEANAYIRYLEGLRAPGRGLSRDEFVSQLRETAFD